MSWWRRPMMMVLARFRSCEKDCGVMVKSFAV